jgi:hypothetical protein
MAAEQLAEFKQAFAASVVHRRLTARPQGAKAITVSHTV